MIKGQTPPPGRFAPAPWAFCPKGGAKRPKIKKINFVSSINIVLLGSKTDYYFCSLYTGLLKKSRFVHSDNTAAKKL